MVALLILSALSIVPQELVVTDTVDQLEVSHYCDGTGKLIFTQIIFWDWNLKENRWEVVDWRLEKECYQILSKEALLTAKQKHKDFYIDLDVKRYLKIKIDDLDRKGIKYKINYPKFKIWCIKNLDLKIPPYSDKYLGSDYSYSTGPNKDRVIFRDPKSRYISREVIFKTKKETWLNYDPELYNRNILRQDKRRELTPYIFKVTDES